MASYCVMTLKKHSGSSNIRALQAEANREHTSELDYYNDVDLSKSSQNVYFVKSENWESDIEDYLAECGIRPKKDAVKAITAVYSGSPEKLNEMSREEQLQYFQDCLHFHENHFGHVISAVVHYDETTPHLQILSVPVVDVPKVRNVYVVDEKATRERNKTFYEAFDLKTYADAEEQATEFGGACNLEVVYELDRSGKKKRKQEKVVDEDGNIVYQRGLNGGRALGNAKHLSKLQTEFAVCVGNTYGFERGACRVDQEDERDHLTALQYKIQKAEKRLTDLNEEYTKKRQEMANFEEYRSSEMKYIQTAKERLKKAEIELKDLIEAGKLHKRQQRMEQLSDNGTMSVRDGYTPWE